VGQCTRGHAGLPLARPGHAIQRSRQSPPVHLPPLEARFGHRTITHSLVFIAGLFVALLPVAWWREDLYYCFCVGYATHPLLDTMTINGVRLFYPVGGGKCVFPMDVNHPHRYRCRRLAFRRYPGGRVPHRLAAGVPVAQEGYERFVRITQGSVESAVRDYNDMSRTHRVLADIRAHNLVTKRSLSGRFELLGSIDERTLVFRRKTAGSDAGNGVSVRLCRRQGHSCAGEEVVTRVNNIDLAGLRMRDLARILNHVSGALLFGTLAVDRDNAVPQTSDGFHRSRGIRIDAPGVCDGARNHGDGSRDVLVIRGR